MNSKLVSVVLPMRNAREYLRAAIESILQQSYSLLELVLVDDGSTDDTAAIADEYAEADDRVTVLRLKPSGLPAALNAGIAFATGEYVARMDADDIAHPERLERQVAHLEVSPACVLVGSAIEVMDADGESLGTRHFAAHHDEIVDEMLRGTFAVAHPTVMVRRDALLAAGGYDPSLYPSDDFALWLELSAIGELANLREPLLRYRRHPRSVSVLLHASQYVLTNRITNAARVNRGLPPLRSRVPASPSSVAARYHFDCARFAVTGGLRLAAARHLCAAILLAPAWGAAWATMAACLLPRQLLFAALAIRARLRAPARRSADAVGYDARPAAEEQAAD